MKCSRCYYEHASHEVLREYWWRDIIAGRRGYSRNPPHFLFLCERALSLRADKEGSRDSLMSPESVDLQHFSQGPGYTACKTTSKPHILVRMGAYNERTWSQSITWRLTFYCHLLFLVYHFSVGNTRKILTRGNSISAPTATPPKCLKDSEILICFCPGQAIGYTKRSWRLGSFVRRHSRVFWMRTDFIRKTIITAVIPTNSRNMSSPAFCFAISSNLPSSGRQWPPSRTVTIPPLQWQMVTVLWANMSVAMVVCSAPPFTCTGELTLGLGAFQI